MKDRAIFIGVAVVAIIVGALVFVSGQGNFSGGPSAAPSYSNETATVVPFTKLAQGTRSSVSTRTNYVITSSSQLSELWKMIDASGTPPTVDFKTHAVLAVFAGQESSTSISVAKIVDSSERLVSITIAKPADACAPKGAVNSPYELITVATTTLPLAHQDLPMTVSCPN